MRNWLPLVFGASLIGLVVASCLVTNELYCDNVKRFCMNPALPYCAFPDHECKMAPFDGFLPPDFTMTGGGDMPPTGCTGTTDCTQDTMPICDTGTKACRACASSADDTQCMTRNVATPHCQASGTGAGTCVACTMATQAQDCTGTTPICNNSGACRKCRAHSECASTVCNADGSCAAASDVAYVNNAVTCSDLVHASTPADPYCQVLAALTLSGKALVVVAGSATAYTPVNLTASLTATVIGPGSAASPTAQLSNPTMSAALNISPTATQTINLTIDGLELVGSAGTAGNKRDGVVCSGTGGTATLTIKNSLIDSSGNAGINSNSCTLNVSATRIIANGAGGISVNGGTYNIENSFIVENTGGSPGVVLGGASTGLFRFNTVAYNHRGGTNEGAFNCSGTQPVEWSIIWGNDKKSNVSIVGSCALTGNIVDDTPTPAKNIGTDPVFVNAGTSDYRIQTSSPAKDAIPATVVDGGAPTLPATDYYGTSRPVGAAWDTGAHEFQ